MPVRVFADEERERLRARMLEAGIPLLREYGMTHMSVEKITAAAGIGKSTFYNFFDSKEAYVCQVIEYKRGDFKTEISELLAGREKLTADEAKAMFRQIIFSEESAYQYEGMMTSEYGYLFYMDYYVAVTADGEAESSRYALSDDGLTLTLTDLDGEWELAYQKEVA